MTTTSFIVLDKQPCRETALLLRGISPDCGRVSLVLHGGQSGSHPTADLFRELEVEFDESRGNGEIFTVCKAETVQDFSPVAEHPRNFRMAVRIGQFLLANMAPAVGLPYTYDTLRTVLAHLALAGEGAWDLVRCSVVLKTAFLYENGLLPEASDAKRSEFLENLVAAGVENTPLPECPDDYFDRLNSWLNTLIEYHQLKK